MTLGEPEAEVPQLTRFGVMRHLGVLEQAGLVVTRNEGFVASAPPNTVGHRRTHTQAVGSRLLLTALELALAWA